MQSSQSYACNGENFCLELQKMQNLHFFFFSFWPLKKFLESFKLTNFIFKWKIILFAFRKYLVSWGSHKFSLIFSSDDKSFFYFYPNKNMKIHFFFRENRLWLLLCLIIFTEDINFFMIDLNWLYLVGSIWALKQQCSTCILINFFFYSIYNFSR